ncbi:hemerythrin domain-containing protein [Prauserella oleivorans]|uniref:Hemerythrin domain-containing protein n=1 Tax=Prauserella oleivorans TaxID=1478153 RepID=A0ABW5W713_9PSEU
MTSAQHKDLVDVIIDDHHAFERVFRELEDRSADPQRRRDLADHVITELVRHSVAEEQFMYPAARRYLENGDELADHEIAEHAEAERTMKDLEGVEPTDPRFDELVGSLIEEVRHHVEDEENDLLPKLRQACGQRELRDLGEQVLRAKETAPTRPHPMAPDTPPANRILDAGAGLIDRMRDKLTGRAH